MHRYQEFKKRDMTFLRYYALSIFIVSYVVLALFVFENFIEPSLKGDLYEQIMADSYTYLIYADYVKMSGGLQVAYKSLVTMSGNFLGPVVVALLCNMNNFLIMLFNTGLFILGYFILVKYSNVHMNKVLLLILLLLNPLMFLSLLSLNKEILGHFVMCVFACYLYNKENRKLLLTAIGLSIFVRWQLTLVMMLFLILNIDRMKPLKYRMYILASIVIVVTVAYPYYTDIVDKYFNIEDLEGNLIVALNDMQNNYQFILAVIPKMLLNMYGSFIKFLTILRLDREIIFTSFVIGSELCFLILTLIMIKKKRFTIRNDLVYFIVFYILMFSITPFVQSRYIFPCYVILCLEIARLSPTSIKANRTKDLSLSWHAGR